MTERPTKRDVFDELLTGKPDDTLFVIFNPRVKGVSVPARLANQTSVALEVGLNMICPIRDLLSHAGGFSGLFRFRGTPAYVHVPWDAVFWIGRGLGTDACVGIEWPADMPADAGHDSEPVKRKRGLPAGWSVIEGGKMSGPNTRGAA